MVVIKNLIATLFLIFFSTSAISEDIKDFQIEGMSIGDSLLDRLSKKQILNQFSITANHYKHLNYPTKFREVYYNDKNFTTYDDMSFFVKSKDPKYTIHMMRGLLTFNENLKECFKIKKKIITEIETIITNYERKYENTSISKQDRSGKSKAYHTVYYLKNGDVFHINCNDWEEYLRKKNNWTEGLTVSIYTKEFAEWLNDY